MFLIRRVHDAELPTNKAAVEAVQRLLRLRFGGVRTEEIDDLPEKLRNPFLHRFSAMLLVAERPRTGDVEGFALVLRDPTLNFCFLDFLAADPESRGGVGAALYERVREDSRAFRADGLFFECPPDAPSPTLDEATLAENRSRLRFYERWGARPVVGTAYEKPVGPGDVDMPYLVCDTLGSTRALRRAHVRQVVRAVLERKYKYLCPPEYVEEVVSSIVDDPLRLREPRYPAAPERSKSRPGAAHERRPWASLYPLVVNENHDIHHIRERGYIEAPVRVSSILESLEASGMFRRVIARQHPLDVITEVHDWAFVRYLQRACAGVPEGKSLYPYVFPIRNKARPPHDLSVRAGYYCIDTFTPLNRNAFLAARGAVDCALTAAAHVADGARLAYALVRPPGHHAERASYGGFCYFNNAAIAAQSLSRLGRVAMLDVDYHHGNGQQDIFYGRADVLTVSIHGHPNFAYPYFSGFEEEEGEGEGLGYNLNIALPEHVSGERYRKALERALARIRDFGARFLVVPLGLDTARGDPTGSWSLVARDFEENGALIGALNLPTVVVQEGGYKTRTIGGCATSFFRGLTRVAQIV